MCVKSTNALNIQALMVLTFSDKQLGRGKQFKIWRIQSSEKLSAITLNYTKPIF